MAEEQFVEGNRARAETVAAEDFPGELRECTVRVLRRLHYHNPLCGSVRKNREAIIFCWPPRSGTHL
jgi:hypothetical protein